MTETPQHYLNAEASVASELMAAQSSQWKVSTCMSRCTQYTAKLHYHAQCVLQKAMSHSLQPAVFMSHSLRPAVFFDGPTQRFHSFEACDCDASQPGQTDSDGGYRPQQALGRWHTPLEVWPDMAYLSSRLATSKVSLCPSAFATTPSNTYSLQ